MTYNQYLRREVERNNFYVNGNWVPELKYYLKEFKIFEVKDKVYILNRISNSVKINELESKIKACERKIKVAGIRFKEGSEWIII